MRSVFLFFLAAAAAAAEFPQPYNSEKAPGEPMSAADAAAKWQVPPGFKVQVFASEPEVQNPIACAWDPRGRLWVAENYTYAERPIRLDPKLRDRVLIFEDADGDGRHDKRTVFTEEVQRLTSVEVGAGGVWLMAPPQLLFLPDRDRDDRPDGPAEVVLDGFDVPPDNYHNFANGLRWGPDGWLYGRCGASCPGLVGVPGTAKENRIPLAGTMWRYHPQRRVFEALSSGATNPWGHDWNEAGELFFTNTVNGHLWHMIPGAHYVRPHTIDTNPYSYELIDQHADHWHFDTSKGWQASRDGKANDLGGGHAHCGAMIYLGDNWPESYRGKLFTLNFHGRRMNVERLEEQGSGYTGRHDGDAFFSADPWFRGLDLTYGPDGAVFVLDWSDTGECHDSTGVHRTSGRIYRISYGDAKKPPVGDLAKLSNSELVKLHEHRNEWYVRMARRVLVDRVLADDDRFGRFTLEPLMRGSGDAVLRNRALQTYQAFGLRLLLDPKMRDVELTPEAVRAIVDDFPLDYVDGRSGKGETWKDGGRLEKGARDRAAELAVLAKTTKSAPIRLAVASSLQRMPIELRTEIAAALVSRGEDADDHNLPLMCWYGIAPLGESHGEKLVEIAKVCELPTTRRLIARRLAVEIEKRPEPLADLLQIATGKSEAFRADILAGLAEGFTGWRKAPKPSSWSTFAEAWPSEDAKAQGALRDLAALFGDGRALDEVKRIALDKTASIDARRSALRTLIDNRPPDLRAICEKVLGERFVNAVAVGGLALSDDPAIGAKLAQSYRSFHGTERKVVIDTLVTRPAWAKALLDQVAAGKVGRDDISAFHARQIRSLKDPSLDRRLAEVWGELRDSSGDKLDLVSKLKTGLTPAALSGANKSAGRQLFQNVCATCHMMYGSGGQIGPDLTGSGRADLDYLLDNIVDPSAVVTADFRLNVVTLKDGRVLNGMVSEQTAKTVTLRTMTEPITVERSEIVKREELPLSLMPEGLLAGLDAQQTRDLVAYLMHPTQVPLPEEAGSR